ncbi:MAG: ABC transporter permease subunit [Candidatus Accumulibacter sp.]|jgi:NitT/TauT family transport system permease protein|nr:ABC transporter permease subunit [Accumulibacter sp.]
MNSSALAMNNQQSPAGDNPPSAFERLSLVSSKTADAAETLARPSAPAQSRPAFHLHWLGAAATLAWSFLAAITLAWPNKPAGFEDWAYTTEFGIAAGAVAVLCALLALISSAPIVFTALAARLLRRAAAAFRHGAPWLIVSALLLALWEIFTAKTGALPPPFFAPPSSMIDVYISDYARLADSAFNSVKLLLEGVLWGTIIGFTIGVSIGWSRAINYWVHPILRFLGPLPPTALLPIAFFFFPSSHAASVFLIALATGFPVAILSWSGVASVNKAYYDVARTMGASEWFLIFRVAIPAALPQVFVGLFMGFGASFVVLIVAEMMGVKSGLGWYLTWAQGYASYVNMYGALIVMTIIFSSLISLLFAVRDRVLVWQKGIVKW